MNKPSRPGYLLALTLLIATTNGARAQEPPPAVESITRQIQAAVDAGKVPALSIALIIDQKVVWSAGFGIADPATETRADADTAYRVGSVSKLFTDVAAMQLVEQGKLDLDQPVSTYLPDFKPINPFDKSITLRQLMSHRSGLVRESPVGHYFDPTSPSIEATVQSLNDTELVFEPESRTSYSNAAITVVGRVVEVVSGEPFAQYVSKHVIDPCGMTNASFVATPEIKAKLAQAIMWTYDDRTSPAPTFALGTLPAGNLYASANDLSKFVLMLMAGGVGPGGRVLKEETIKSMYIPQFQAAGARSGFGLGFALGDLDGELAVGHGGAVYGFSTQVQFLPEKKLGVVVMASRDCANGLVNRIARQAISSVIDGTAAPTVDSPPFVTDHAELAKLEGRYSDEEGGFDVWLQGGHLYSMPLRGGVRSEWSVDSDGSCLIGGIIQEGIARFARQPDGSLVEKRLEVGKVVDGRVLREVEVPKPSPPPHAWEGLIGEYGWPHNVLYILERDGKLHALIEWFFLYPLEDLGNDTFAFPDWGLYQGEKLIFERDRFGRARKVVAASVPFERRSIPGEDGTTFQINPIRPVDELRKEALHATPPEEEGEFRDADLVELAKLEPGIKLDIRYATTKNFVGAPFYSQARAFLQRPAAEALVRAHHSLEKQGYGLLIHDAYRPWSVTKMFWEATPQESRGFVANPAAGSKHNRGCAVDLTLFDRSTGEAVDMVGGYDEFSDRSAAFYPGGTDLQRWQRALLREAMEAQGFNVISNEWWHFDYQDWPKYRIQNTSFENLGSD
jgi:CubicO group peptidase (beta-lactamase class C family)/D-alanyl-D-alanine dipeptidase